MKIKENTWNDRFNQNNMISGKITNHRHANRRKKYYLDPTLLETTKGKNITSTLPCSKPPKGKM